MNWLYRILDLIAGQCRHDKVTWPTHGRQYCNDCGSFRFYPEIGATPSRWYQYKYEGHGQPPKQVKG